MALKILKNLFGDKSTKDRKEYQPSIDETNRLQQTLAGLSDDELRGKTAEFQIANHKKVQVSLRLN